MSKTVMLCGIGEVGGWALEFLARSEGVDRIVTSDVNEEWGAYRTNVAAVGSIYQGFSKKFEFHRSDLNDIDATARLLEEIKPDVIFTSVTIQGPRVLRTTPLSQDVRDRLWAAGFGAWLPWHLLLPAKLMQAVQKSGIQTHMLNASFPDVVGPAIWNRFGFGPTVGIGNHDLLAANIIKYVSMTEGVPAQDVILYFVGSHALYEHGSKAGVPFFLKIILGDKDITSKYDVNWLTEDCMLSIRWKIAKQTVVYSSTAASAVKNVMAIIRDTNEYTHAPAPNGLPGGYPVRLSAKGAEVILPKELTLEQAVKINEEANKFDGIEKIKDDGTIVYTDKTYSIMKELGYNCKELSFDELESRAEELKALHRKLAASGSK